MSHHTTIDELHDLNHNNCDEFVYSGADASKLNSDNYDTIENTNNAVSNHSQKQSAKKKGGWKRIGLYSITFLSFLSIILLFGFYYMPNHYVHDEVTSGAKNSNFKEMLEEEEERVNSLVDVQDNKSIIDQSNPTESLQDNSHTILDKGDSLKEQDTFITENPITHSSLVKETTNSQYSNHHDVQIGSSRKAIVNKITLQNIRKSIKSVVRTTILDYYEMRRKTYPNNYTPPPNLLFFKFHKVGGSSFTTTIEYLFTNGLSYSAVEEDNESCKKNAKALVKASEVEEKIAVCGKHPGLEFPANLWKNLMSIVDEIEIPNIEGTFDEKELSSIKQEAIRETIADSSLSYNIFMNFGKNQENNKAATILRHPISKLNSYFYYRRHINANRKKNGNPKHKLHTSQKTYKNLHKQRMCWGDDWQKPQDDENNVNDWIRRLYQESSAHPELIRCLNEYTNVLVSGSSVENAKVMLDKIDVVGFNEEFDIATEKLVDALGLPKDILDTYSPPKEKEIPSIEKKPVSYIGNEEMKLLEELLKDDIELYKYAFEKYSHYATEHPGEVKPFHL